MDIKLLVISHYIQILNHYGAHIKLILMLHVNYTKKKMYVYTCLCIGTHIHSPISVNANGFCLGKKTTGYSMLINNNE